MQKSYQIKNIWAICKRSIYLYNLSNNKEDDTVPQGPKDLYCGSDIVVPSTGFVPRSIPWQSSDLLGVCQPSDVTLPVDLRGQLKPVLWNDLRSEHDAENFCVRLGSLGMQLSPEFLAFEHAWRRDEWNHYLGFRAIYCLVYGESEEAVIARLATQPQNFDPIAPFMADEFAMCLLLAYDEIVTTRSYAADYPRYRAFGHPAFLQWIQRVTRDEAYHYHNAMQVIKHRHPHRIGEIGAVIDEIVAVDMGSSEYEGTFVLDHTGFPPDFLHSCAQLIKDYF